MRPSRRQEPWEPLPPPEHSALRESVERLIALAIDLPYERTQREALKIAWFQWTEEGGGRRKNLPRYRSKQVVEQPDAKCRHEHVVERAWLSRVVLARRDLVGAALDIAVACLVTPEEHALIKPHAERFGWERYRDAGIVVLDAAQGFCEVDLGPLIDTQSQQRRRIEREVGALDGGLTLQVTDGGSVELGTVDDLRAALGEIAAATGGSSHRGRFSYLFGLQAEQVSPEIAGRLGQEAVEFRELFADSLSPATLGLLGRLAELRSGDGA